MARRSLLHIVLEVVRYFVVWVVLNCVTTAKYVQVASSPERQLSNLGSNVANLPHCAEFRGKLQACVLHHITLFQYAHTSMKQAYEGVGNSQLN